MKRALPFFALALLGTALAAPGPLRRGANLEGWMNLRPFAPLTAARLADLARVKAAGFDFVRVPLDPALLIEARPGAAEPDGSLARLAREAKARGLRVVLALSPDGERRASALRGGTARDTYLALLERLARRLGELGRDTFVLEPLDTPVDPSRWDCGASGFDWDAVQGDMLRAVRRGERDLDVLASGACYADGASLTNLRPLSDPRVVYGFQFLDPLVFTQQGNPTNGDWTGLRGVPYPATEAGVRAALPASLAGFAGDAAKRAARDALVAYGASGFGPNRVDDAVGAVGAWAKRRGVPVLLKAFTVHGSAPKADRARYLRDVRSAAERAGVPWAVWTWESPFGFGISRGGKLDPALKRALGL